MISRDELGAVATITVRTGYEIPQLGLGTWQLRGEECIRAVRAAIESGYRHIDTANAYGNHHEIARAIRESGIGREHLHITSKAWYEHLSYDLLIAECEQALRELKYIDLYLIHWPNRAVSMRETFQAMKALLNEGKIRMVGVSNYTKAHLEEALSVSEVPIVTNQVEFHPYLNQSSLLAYCRDRDVVLTAYTPLARGRILEDTVLRRIADARSRTPAQIVLRWLVQKDIIVIPRSKNPTRIRENADIFDFRLSSEEMEAINRRNEDLRLVHPSFAEFD